MTKTLVAYYSWTGHTQQIAEAIAGELRADVEPIGELRPRAGWVAYVRSAWEVLRAKAVALKPPEKDASQYDLIVLGTPVWAGRMSSPIRAYILDQRASFKRIALFCTEGGANGEKALAQVASLCGKDPVATLVVTERDMTSRVAHRKVLEFVKALN